MSETKLPRIEVQQDGHVRLIDDDPERGCNLNIEMVSLDRWANAINKINESKGWNDHNRSESEWAALAHSEISEAYEEYRKGNYPDFIYAFGHKDDECSIPCEISGFEINEKFKPEGMAIEYADALYRILHWFAQHKISPSYAIALKMRYNLTRPFRHGGKVT